MGKKGTAEQLAASVWRRRNARDREESLAVWLQERRARLLSRLAELKVPADAWRDASPTPPSLITDPECEPYERFGIFIPNGSRLALWREKAVLPRDEALINEVDWTAVEAWIADQALNALGTGDRQILWNLSRLLTACEANRRYPTRQAEIVGEKISIGRGTAMAGFNNWVWSEYQRLVNAGLAHNRACLAVLNNPVYVRRCRDTSSVPTNLRALSARILRMKKKEQKKLVRT
jgi:hypothetical protein